MSPQTYPKETVFAAVFSVVFVVIFWMISGTAWSLLMVPVLAFWTNGVYLRGNLMEAPIQQWPSVLAYWKSL